MKKIFMLLAFLSVSCAAEDFSDNFSSGAFNLKWNSSIDDAKFLFPNGSFRPLHSRENRISFVVLNDINLSWYEIPTEEVYFTYSPKMKLDHVRVFFKYQDLEQVKKKCLDVFGADFIAREKNGEQSFVWKNTRSVTLAINSNAPTQWVYLYLQ
jgi:hypothetical protein